MQVYNDELYHYGVIGMKWEHHKRVDIMSAKSSINKAVYALNAKANPRELKYKVRKITNKVDDDVKLLADLTVDAT